MTLLGVKNCTKLTIQWEPQRLDWPAVTARRTDRRDQRYRITFCVMGGSGFGGFLLISPILLFIDGPGAGKSNGAGSERLGKHSLFLVTGWKRETRHVGHSRGVRAPKGKSCVSFRGHSGGPAHNYMYLPLNPARNCLVLHQ